MAFENPELPIFPSTPTGDSELIRYMSIDKFEHLMTTKSLYFTRASKFIDSEEGNFGTTNEALSPSLYGVHHELISKYRSELPGILREVVHVSCWSSSTETLDMWDEFGDSGKGVALKTTWTNLTNSLQTPLPIFGGCVEYENRNDIFIPERNVFHPFVYKDKRFSKESEVRLISMWLGDTQGKINGLYPHSPEPLLVPVDLNLLISSVVFGPNTSSLSISSVEKHMFEKFLVIPTKKSTL